MSNVLDNEVPIGEVVQQYDSGTVRKFTLDNGYEFEAFIPDNYNSSVPVMIYEHGDGGYSIDWEGFTKKFESDGCSSIIIRADRKESMDLYNYVVEQYNLTPSTSMTVSFSGGTRVAMYETAQLIEQNPDNPPVTVLLDGCLQVAYLNRDGVTNKIIESDAIVLAFGRPGSNDFNDQYQAFARTGANIIIFTDKSQFGNSHRGVNISFTEGDLLEYVLGESELPDRYEISVYDTEKKQFVTLDYSQVSTLDKVYEYYGVDILQTRISKVTSLKDYYINSDSDELLKYANSIVGLIKKSNFLTYSFDNFSGSSSTMVPSGIPACVCKYFNDVSRCLIKLSSLVETISKIDSTYGEVDQKLANSVVKDNIVTNDTDTLTLSSNEEFLSSFVDDLSDFFDEIG